MRANEIFNIKLNIDNKICFFEGRVLYWWEEQNIKMDSIYEDKQTKKMAVDQSKVYTLTMNKFLISVESEGNKKTKEDLYKESIEKNKNIEWSDVLHYSVTIPLYSAYVDASGSSVTKMEDFRKKVIAAYDKDIRIGGFEDFPSPPELIEFNFTQGRLSRSDMMNMSYSELLKYQTIFEIDMRYKKGAVKTQDPKENLFQPTTMGMLINASKQSFPDVTVA